MSAVKQLRFWLAKTSFRKGLTWYYHRRLDPGDTFIASYPRSGSTWLRFQLYEILSGQISDFGTVEKSIPGVKNRQSAVPVLPGERCLIQTHEPFQRDYGRAVYLVRDPRDVVISEYYFLLRKGFVSGEFDHFLDNFVNGRVNPFSKWSDHINSWLDAGKYLGENLLVVEYEKMRNDPLAETKRVIDFLDVSINPERFEEAVNNNSFERMREKEEKTPEDHFKIQNRAIRFVRSGESGGWRKILTEAQVQIIEESLGNTLLRLGYPLKTATDLVSSYSI